MIGAGVMPDTMLARAAGLTLDEERGGVLCDARLRTSAPGVWAAGDIASYDSRPNGRRIRIEHWDVAFNHGKTAALNMLGQEVEHDVVPYFFSDLADWASLEYVGPAASWDREIVRGSLDEGSSASGTSPADGVEGALSVGRSDDLEHARRLIAGREPLGDERADALGDARQRSRGALTRGRRRRSRTRASGSRRSSSRCARFVHASGALEATLLLDQGAELPVLVVECPAVGPVLLGEGEDVVQLDADRLAAAPLPLPEVRALPPFEVDAVRAEITAPLGGVEHQARAVRELAGAFPGRSVLSVEFATTDVETPLTIAARSRRPDRARAGGRRAVRDAAGLAAGIRQT